MGESILIIEDDPGFALALGEMLREAGYRVTAFEDANSAFEWLKTYRPELVISDIGLPGISGIQFCRLVREDAGFDGIPLVVLSARVEERYKVEALKNGADDYITKPFSARELLARVEAVLRRSKGGRSAWKTIRSGKMELNGDTGEVRIAGVKLELLPKEFSLLEFFLKSNGRILTYAVIAEAVWGYDAMATRNTIKTTVSRLKAKLGEYGGCIEPITGVGYKWTDKTAGVGRNNEVGGKEE